METKICTKCGLELPKTSEYFQTRKDRKNRIEGICKKCRTKDRKKYNKEHKEIIYVYKKQYREDHKESIAEYKRQYQTKNKEAIAKQRKEFYEEHKEAFAMYAKQRRINNKDLSNLRKEYRRAAKRKLPCTLTVQQWETAKQYVNNTCAYCGKELPLEQEHFIPLSKGGEFTNNNIIPSCRSCNSCKRDKDFFKWYPKQIYYNKNREFKILKFLNYKNGQQQLKIL